MLNMIPFIKAMKLGNKPCTILGLSLSKRYLLYISYISLNCFHSAVMPDATCFSVSRLAQMLCALNDD